MCGSPEFITSYERYTRQVASWGGVPGGDRILLNNRRAFKRYNLRLPVLLFRSGSPIPIVGETSDISIDGFFCRVDEPFAVGEVLRSLVLLANPCPEPENCTPTCIEGEVEVMHVVADRTKSVFGIGCHVHNYRMVSTPVIAEEYLAPVQSGG